MAFADEQPGMSSEAEQGSLLAETTPDTTPDTTPSVPRRCFVAHVGCALSLALVLLLGFGEKAGMDMANLKEFQQKQAVPAVQFQVGGTLVPGPGCPVTCGEFVECAFDRRSKQNLLDLQWLADGQNETAAAGLPGGDLAYDTAKGSLVIAPQLVAFLKPTRLANKQVIPMTPDFQCPNTSCWIPRGYLNDDYCDCPGSCADEEFHSCEECGVGLTSFSSFSVSPDVCPDRGCRDPALDRFFSQRCLGPGVVTDPFICPDDGGTPGCTINKSLVDNNVCDCPGTCADETNYTCDNCSCVSFCGVSSRWACSPSYGVFQCPPVAPLEVGCAIPSLLVNNSICDCPWTCADEAPQQEYMGQVYPVNCDVCQCPTACEQLYNYYYADFTEVLEASGGFIRCTEVQALAQLPRFQCPPPGNCSLPIGFVNDNVCDCPGTCADEEDWDCDTCVCPDVCGIRNRNCFDVFFACPLSNCSINIFRLNNGRCDCPDCADENNFTCDTCGSGCPTNETCHQNFGYPCEFQIVECPPPPDSVNPFGLRCFIPISYLNDNFCDCLDCVDEEAWDCNNCSSGCPMQCRANPFNFFGTVFTFRNERGTNEQKAANCFGQQFNLNFAVQCPGYPANSILPTKLGCTIPYSALNDNRCDCPTCRDETTETCGDGVCSSSIFCSPGGVNSRICKCPSSCGESTSCAGKCMGDPLLVEVDAGFPRECLYYCPGACPKHVQILNNSVCDCVNCEDEADSSCDTCQCPAAPLGPYQFNPQGCGFEPLDVVLQGQGLLDSALGLKLRCFNGTDNGTSPPPPPPPPPPDRPTFPPDRPTFPPGGGPTFPPGGGPTLPPGVPTLVPGVPVGPFGPTFPPGSLPPGGPTFLPPVGPDDIDESMAHELLERASKTPRNHRLELALDDFVSRALADDDVRKAMESATAEGYSGPALQAELDALAASIGMGKKSRAYGLMRSALAEREVQKVLENCVTKGYSEAAKEEVRQLVLKKAMARERLERQGVSIPYLRSTLPSAGDKTSRRLQSTLAEAFKPLETFDCPGTECFISESRVNDRVCDCPGCEDEEAFGCGTCIPVVPLGSVPVPAQTNIGVAVGVSLGVAVGVGLGVGLGLSAALSGVFAAVGLVQFTVANAQEFIDNPNVQQGLKKAFIRLAGLAIAEAAVTLNWACAGDALAQLNSKLRRLGEAVKLCFEIEIEGEQQSLEACELLAGTSPGNAARVINEELKEVSDQEVQVVQWTANPNPRSKNPTQNTELPRPFEAPKAVGLDAGALLPAPVGPKAPVVGAPVGAPVGPPAVQSPVVVDGMDPSRGIKFSFN